MRLSKYYYDPETCRYEPQPTSISSLVSYAILFTVSTALIFWGVLSLHSKLFLSEKGKALKNENTTLVKHHASLLGELANVEGVLTSLNDKNSDLHKKLFETSLITTPSSNKKNNDVLLADGSNFMSAANELLEESSAVSQLSKSHNAGFATIEVHDKELQFLMSIPSIQPVENKNLTRLASGFGKRIHPFHKANYDHPGVDFAATRGESVMATATGVVVDLRKGSTLQAGYGNYIEIDHGNGIITRYAHLEDVLVRLGQKVSKGSPIGTVGMSGGAIAPHVHYEIIRNGKQVNPVPYMLESLNSKEYTQLVDLSDKKNQALD
jgi:murein DD-endopeptidase MepM/ murein hydrolase activator NlpD